MKIKSDLPTLFFSEDETGNTNIFLFGLMGTGRLQTTLKPIW